MLKKILLAVLLALIVVTPVLAQDPIYLPLIVKGSGGGPMLPAELYITDGTTSISFIKPEGVSGYHLVSWRPQVADYKGGGTWQDSPLADGRRLVDKRFMNVIETFRLTAQGENPDALIEELQEMRRLLEKAADYWATNWQNEPVWIVARAHDETERRYTLIHRGRIPEDDNPYAQPFMQVNGCPVMNNLTLVIERGPWLGYAPGESICAKASGTQIDWRYSLWTVNTALPVNQVRKVLELQSTPGRLLAGEVNEVWRTDDGGATPWVASTIPPGITVYSMVEDVAGGIVYASGNIGVWRSVDSGVNWLLCNAVENSNSKDSLALGNDGFLYMNTAAGVRRSTDGGITWTTVLADPTAQTVFQASDGYIYTVSYEVNYLVWRTLNGTTWTQVAALPLSGVPRFIKEPGDGYLYIGDSAGNLFRSANGVNWGLIGNIYPFNPEDIILASDGYLYLSWSNSVILKSPDGISWGLETNLGAQNVYSLVEYSGDGRIYAGEIGDVWRSSAYTSIGRSATCDDEVFVANKQNVAQLTHVKVYDASVPSYTDRFPAGAFPYQLLPNPMANGDAIILSIDTTGITDSGPFDNAVFDISVPALGTFTLTWYYPSGIAAAFPPPGAGWTALNLYDGTGEFQVAGVNSLHFVPPDDWTVVTINGVTGYHIVGIISAVAGAPVGPQQGNRDVYTTNWAYSEIDEAQVLGDVPALMQFKFHNRSDEDGYETSDELDLLENRVIVGLRSLDRGDTFTAYLNCADEQNPIGITATVTAPATSFIDEIQAPSGRAAEHLTWGLGLTRYTTEVTFTFDPSITRDYYGVYHAYVRAQLHESGVYTSGDQDDVRVRLQTQSGSGGVIHTTKYQEFTGVDAWGVTEEEVYKDWQLLDFGQIRLPVTQRLRADELPDQMSVSIQVASAAGTLLLVDFYDLVLIPVDEWAGDFVDHALETDSCVENGYMLDVDSVTYPKYDIRAQVRTFGGELLRADWQSIVPGPAILQANADQKLWFLTARAIYMGIDTAGAAATTLTDANADFTKGGVKPGMAAYNLTTGNNARITAVGTTTCTTEAIVGSWNANDEYMIICPNWRSEPWVVHSIRVFNNPRYLSMRGAR